MTLDGVRLADPVIEFAPRFISAEGYLRARIITARQFLGQLGEKKKRSPKRKVAAARRRNGKT